MDDEGREICELSCDATALSSDGQTALCVSRGELALIDIDRGRSSHHIDFASVLPALAIPADGHDHEL